VLALSETDTAPVFLGSENIKPVGFDSKEGLLPYPASSFIGYRLLTEYFTFPEKFMFVDLTGLADKIPDNAGNTLDIYIYLNSSDIELEHNVSAEGFLLGCTPMINLFEHTTDPIKLDHTQHEYQIIPDARRPIGYEIYSVDEVVATSSSGKEEHYTPFYGMNHSQNNTGAHSFWFATRKNSKSGLFSRDEGTDMYLSLVDLEFNPNVPEDHTITLKTTCSNRDLPGKLPFSSDQPMLQCVDSAPPCSSIRCLTRPTQVIRAPLRDHARWRLISHLNLNHLSLTGGDDATMALKEILRLYDFKESFVTRALIESIIKVQAKPISAPLNIDGHATMCRGMEIEVELDDSLLTGSSAYLFDHIRTFLHYTAQSIHSPGYS